MLTTATDADAALPAPLDQWAAALGLFPRELALELGAWLPRLAMAFGPLRSRSTEGADEPDGFDGLSRRGPYERLLASEWALAEELPDEFNRRAATGEHAFLRLAFRAPAGHRRCLALFDTGPSQLGVPRLAHLAVLVVLERRAAEARAEFLWGVVQQPAGRFLTGINRSAVEHWMRARCAAEPRPEDVREWRAAWGRPAADDEVWLVGGRRLAGCDPAASRVLVAETDGALAVRLEPRGGVAREVSLPVPSDEICTRLIREPLRREAPLGRSARRAPNFVFVGGGSRFLYGTKTGTLVTHIIPGSPGFSSSPLTWQPPRDEEVVAAGWDKGLLLVTKQREGHALRVNWYNKRGHLRGQGAWHLPPPEDAIDYGVAGHLPGTLGACIQAPGWRLVTSHGELVELEPDRTYQVQSTNVIGLAVSKQRLLTVEKSHGEAYLELLPRSPGADVRFPAPGRAIERPGAVNVQLFRPPKEKVIGLFADLASQTGLVTVRGVAADAPVVFGYDSAAEVNAAVALQLIDGRWRVVRLRKNIEAVDLAVPPGATVHGVACLDPGDVPGLIVVEKDGCTISVCTGKVMQRVVRAPARVVRLGVSPYSSHFAYEDEAGLLCVFSLRRKQIVLRLQCGDDA